MRSESDRANHSGCLSAIVIDDDPGDLLLARRVLERSDCFDQVSEATSADQALDVLNDFDGSSTLHRAWFPPAVIFLDIWMPKKTGYDFLEEFALLRSREEYREIAVIMLTSSSADEDRRRAGEFDFVMDYLVKPLTVADTEKFRHALDNLAEFPAFEKDPR